MWMRRQIRRLAFPAAVVLSLWVMIAGAVFSDGAAAALGTVVVAPVLFVALAVVAALTTLRGSVRRSRAVDPADAALLPAWWLSIVLCVLPLPGAGWYGLAVVVLGLAAFWHALWRLWSSAREHLGAMRLHGAPATAPRAPGPGRPSGGTAGEVHEVIVVEEGHEPHRADG